MSQPAKALPTSSPAPAHGLSRPVILNASDLALPPVAEPLRYIDAPATPTAQPAASPQPRKKDSAVLRGIKDLQDLQKQTIAVLESVKGTLLDIQQVLRSPEATRGMEKQLNAATLLSKGFAREAIEQAHGAVALLPANPEAHLLLSLSLAADQQIEASLAMARKGLALVDRRNHPLAIECGLLHALAALGCAGEALDRWGAIVDGLPLPVLFEQMARIASCFPSESLGGGPELLDEFLNRRIVRDEQRAAASSAADRRERLRSTGQVELQPHQIPAQTLFAGLDAAHDHALMLTHRALLAQIARRLQLVDNAADVVKFITECVVPLANRALDRSAGALARASVKRLLRFHADVPTLHRALTKLELAGTQTAHEEIAVLLAHWRGEGNKVARAHFGLKLSGLLFAAGLGILAWVLFFMNGGGALAGKSTLLFTLSARRIDALTLGPAIFFAGFITAIASLMNRTWHLALPFNRPPLTPEELRVLNSAEVRKSLRSAFAHA